MVRECSSFSLPTPSSASELYARPAILLSFDDANSLRLPRAPTGLLSAVPGISGAHFFVLRRALPHFRPAGRVKEEEGRCKYFIN